MLLPLLSSLSLFNEIKGMSDRPLTQQGLSGITTSYGRIGTGTAASSMRQVKDKRYWMSLIQTKLQEILQETEKLKREKKNLDRETSARKLYEKKVKEQAKELSSNLINFYYLSAYNLKIPLINLLPTALHAKLTEMNLALDTGGNGASRQLLQNEAVAFREKNEVMQNQLEQIFKDRQAKENHNQQLEEAMESEKAKVDELIFSLNPDDQNKYRELQIICERLKSENAEIHGTIEETVKRKEKLSANVMNSQSRMEAIKLQSKLREVVAKRNQLKDEEVNRLTPAQEREKLISEVRVNNQSINSINKQMKIVSDQLQEKRDNLQLIEQDMEEGKNSSERYVKFRELKKRDEMMSTFLDSFHTQLAKEKQSELRLFLLIKSLYERVLNFQTWRF
jgi:intraflagellar transport protein 74